jgi:2-aminoadipate transaminase
VEDVTLADGVSGEAVQTGRRWATTSVEDVLSLWAKSVPPQGGGWASEDPKVIVFGAGEPDPETLPWEGLANAARTVLQSDSWGALKYGGTQGEETLRRWLADRLNRQENAGVTAENFFLTNGSGQAIQMVIAAFSDPGDPMLVESPTYPAAMRVMRANHARPVGVEMDPEGVVPQALEETIQRLAAAGRAPRLFYTMPTFHNPAGYTTTLARREAVVEICDRHGVLLMEDDAYGEIRVDGERLPSYYKLTDGYGALRLSTVSKMLAPGLRIGWVTARKDIIDVLVGLRMDGGLSPFLLRTVAEFFTSGQEDAHLEKMVPVYREKRDRMISALTERCGRHTSWEQPDGGFFLWVKLARHIDPERLKSAMGEENVSARPGTQFSPDGSHGNYLRLCFSTVTVPEIEEGIQRLGRALDKSVR